MMSPLEAHRAVTAELVAAIRDCATVEIDAEVAWLNGYLYSQATSSSGKENDARAASSLQRREVIRQRGEVQAHLARERLAALEVQAGLAALQQFETGSAK
jgi:hypothetical protein